MNHFQMCVRKWRVPAVEAGPAVLLAAVWHAALA
jgi:hypothetical protein